MRAQDWTEEPWPADPADVHIFAALANRHRAAACVNACKNIPTESLEQAAETGVVAINGGTPVQLFRETKARLTEAETLLRDYGSIMEGFDTVNWPAMSKWRRARDAFVNTTAAPS